MIRKVDTSTCTPGYSHYEFDCVDCGCYVFLISAYPPTVPRCAVCGWLEGIENPDERAKLKTFLNRNEQGTA